MEVHYSIGGSGLGRITLSRPPYNALDRPDFEDPRRLEAFLATPQLKGAVVCGAKRHFCAGADLAHLAQQQEDPAALAAALSQGQALLEILASAPVPLVAAVRGSCLGAGLEIALACHLRVASVNALLGFPEAGLGLLPGLGGTVLAPQVLGLRAAADLMLSGRLVGAAEALGLGLVDQVVPTRELLQQADGLLRRLTAKRPPHVIRGIMQAIHNSCRLPRHEALVRETELFFQVAGQTMATER